MKEKIFIGTHNSYKKLKLTSIVKNYFDPIYLSDKIKYKEIGETFLEVAENKAMFYSAQAKGLAIATDSGAVIPALNNWDPLRTKRFANNDLNRIENLLNLMKNKKDRRLEWHEALAVARNGKLLFSVQHKAMDAQISRCFNPKFYQEGIWLCSISEFPKFGNKNYFELNSKERLQTEDSWQKLKRNFKVFVKSYYKNTQKID